MDQLELKNEISDYVDSRMDYLWDLSNYVYSHAEIVFNEYQTSQKLVQVLKDEGFEVEEKAGGLDTAFCATFSTNTVKKPRIDILCEYDALDLGEAIKEGSKIVHACGHNIIATTGVGAGIAMKHILEKYNLPGEIRVVGTPAEEGGGGKIIMQKAGVFDDTDAMILLHPTSGKSKIAGRCKTSISYDVSYHGVPAHAGNHRHKGINAHDAAVICYTSVGLLRYQTTDDVQLFVRFTDVGKESGVIPSIAKLQVQVKSFNPNSVQMMAPKVKNCIEAGALATGCKVDIKEKIGYLGRIYNHTFEKYLRANFELLGEPLKDGMVDDNGGEDFGNLMRKVPGIMPYPSLIPEKRVALHTTDYLKLVTTPRARYVVGLGSKVMADTVVDLLLNPSIIEEAKKEMQACEKGAREAGHDVTSISLKGKEIQFCIGCLSCLKTGACIIKDDVPEIMEQVRNAEVLVLATPIYYFEMSGQMKTLLDCLNPLYESDYAFRDVYMLATAAEAEPTTFDKVYSGLEGWVDCFEKASLKGVVAGKGISESKEALEHPDVLKEAYELGKNL